MDIALFSPSSLFPDEDDSCSDEQETENQQSYEERNHEFPGMVGDQISQRYSAGSTKILCFNLHQRLGKPVKTQESRTFAFAEWLVQHRSWIGGRRCIELGSGTGALAIFLRKSFNLDITTSDYYDQEIEENIAHNCQVNGITPALPHIKHTWGDAFPSTDHYWDLIIASDILLYVKQYANLIKTLSFLLHSYKLKDKEVSPLETIENDADMAGETGLSRPVFLMSWRRRIGKDDEKLFFSGCVDAGLEVKHLDSRVYCIRPLNSTGKDSE